MSEYGLKIKNISAGMLYDVNLGIRDYFTYSDAMLNNSLFSFFLQQNGMVIHKGESTRDIICLDFDFGSRSYKDEISRLTKLLAKTTNTEQKERLRKAIDNVESKKELYSPKSRDEIRELFYENGVDITYNAQTIHYEMLFRTSAKAKLGQVIFINSLLYKKAYDWLTMGLGEKMPKEDAKIVEMSAYAPLTTSTIISTIHIPVQNILILKDQDSLFKTLVNVVSAQEYTDKKDEEKKKCVVTQKEAEIKNTLWDGMGLIESSILPSWINGMALLRNHMFKMCGFKTNIQRFFQDWCLENKQDYNTYQVQDMFGMWHYLKDIQIITTDNSIKWKKFSSLMGHSLEAAYSYWCEKIHADGDIWGIVKTDHQSKLGDCQQLSYQMINTLPCEKEDIKDIAKTSIDYVELLKRDNDAFESYLRKNSNEINHFEMLADLYKRNPAFGNSTWFRYEKTQIIREYVYKIKSGKVLVNGDNLTVCGNPYALLLYAVGLDWKNDPTLAPEKDSIQCYTSLFKDGEYLAGFRNPHNSPNNICYLHNTYSDEMQRYFDFSNNIIAVNNIGTDIQDRCNSMDYDSDFMLITNQPTLVKNARLCYKNYPTIVNQLKESGITYKNTKKEYASMDNKFSKSRLGIGWSSNLAQLALTYYWTEKEKEYPDEDLCNELYDNFIILSVLAQVIIDGCKREYEVSGMEEIKRISKLPSMVRTKSFINNRNEEVKVKCDYPLFMQYTKEISRTKNGKEIPFEEVEASKTKLKSRIDDSLSCPMNWLEECIDKIPGVPPTHTIPTKHFFIKMPGTANNRQMSKIRTIIEDYDSYIKQARIDMDDNEELYVASMIEKSNAVVAELQKIKIGNIVTINRLIETALGLEADNNNSKCYKNGTKYARKMLNYLYKVNKEKFLLNFL